MSILEEEVSDILEEETDYSSANPSIDYEVTFRVTDKRNPEKSSEQTKILTKKELIELYLSNNKPPYKKIDFLRIVQLHYDLQHRLRETTEIYPNERGIMKQIALRGFVKQLRTDPPPSPHPLPRKHRVATDIDSFN